MLNRYLTISKLELGQIINQVHVLIQLNADLKCL